MIVGLYIAFIVNFDQHVAKAALEQPLGGRIGGSNDSRFIFQSVILPEARKCLVAKDWAELDTAFAANRDPLTGKYPRDPLYNRLFTRIVMIAPEPVGLGSSR